MESETMILQSVTIPPVLPPKTKLRTVISHQMNSSETGIFESEALRYPSADSARPDSGTTQSSTVASSSQSGSASSLVGFSSRSSQSTVFLAANADQYGSTPASVHQPPRNGHVVTIRINPTDNNPQQHNNNTQPKQQPLIVNASMDGVTTFKGNTKVSLNQTSPINTIGKFIVNICENGERNNRVIEETSSYSINNNDSTAPLNGCVRISVGATETINSKDETDSMVQKTEGLIKPSSNGDMGSPYFFCNPFPCSPTNLMSSGQCSPSDTLDSGTCSDLDGTPPPLPKKKLSKSNGTGHKRVSVTVIGATTHDRAPSVTSSGAEVDSEDSESNISCDSLNSSELSSASLHEDSTAVTFKSEILKSASLLSPTVKPPVVVDGMPCAPKMPTFLNTANTSSGFLPQGLLQDIRDRSAKLSTVIIPQEEQVKTSWSEIEKRVELTPVKKEVAIKPEEKLTSFKLVSQINTVNRKIKTNDVSSMPPVIIDTIPAFPKIVDTTPAYTKVISIVNESTYVDRKLQEEKQKKDQLYSGNFLYDTDKYYNFHLNENVFDNETSENDKKGKKKNGVSVNGKSVCSSSSDSEYMDEESMEYFAGYKDYKNEDGPAAIRSAKGTIRGVKNRVRAGIATFLQMQNTSTKSYKEKDAGKIVFYTTSMGIVRDTYQKCVLVKKILRNLLVKFEERDVFMSMEYQEEIKDRMHSSDVMVPQLFVDGQHIGGAETVEILNEAGELRRMLKPYKSADACTTCQMCGGYRLLPCQVCSGSKKSVHRNHFTAEFVALKCMNCDEVGLVKCEAC